MTTEPMITEPNLEFAQNPEQRCACVLLIDTSGSMAGPRIAAVNSGLKKLIESVRNHTLAKVRSDIAIMTFDDEVKLIQDFSNVDGFEAPTLTAQGRTFIGKAIQEAFHRLQARKQTYKNNGVPYYRPWLFILTDGEPQGEPAEDVNKAAAELSTAQNEKRVAVFPFGVGEANMETLARITSPARPKHLEETDFPALFEWFSVSLGKQTEAAVGQQVSFDNPSW